VIFRKSFDQDGDLLLFFKWRVFDLPRVWQIGKFFSRLEMSSSTTISNVPWKIDVKEIYHVTVCG